MRKSGKNARDSIAPGGDVAELRQALDAAGWRFTRQRAAVFGYLRSVHTHPTAEEVYSSVRRSLPNISLATVYKCLEALVTCKLAAKLTFGDGPSRYDCRTDNHYHFRCLKSHQVRDLDVEHDPNLLEKLAPHLVERLEQQGFRVTDYRLEFLGYADGQ
jgi:Fur family transcriptional regulator, peroxide stress response regulator